MALAPDTDARLAAAIAALRAEQMEGRPDVPMPGHVSLGELARRADCSPATVHKIQQSGLAKFAAGCLRHGITPEELRAIRFALFH